MQHYQPLEKLELQPSFKAEEIETYIISIQAIVYRQFIIVEKLSKQTNNDQAFSHSWIS